MERPLVFAVQRFSLHDGPGIRTTAFFKGCPLRCAWCHNPESLRFEAEQIFRPALCKQCGRCAEGCVHDARVLAGQAYAVDELTSLLLRDRQVYETSGGGVTLSGGEVLAQDGDYLFELLTALKRRGVHVAVDTSGFAPWAKIEALMPLVSLWLYDFKLLDAQRHMSATGVDNAQILENMRHLSRAGAPMWLRVPVVPGVNADDAQMMEMARYARLHISPARVCLLPYHKLGQDKLGGAPQGDGFEEPSAKRMFEIQDIWLDVGFSDVSIGG